MEQKIIYQRFLTTGIINIIFSIGFLISCTDIDYLVKTDYVFINETEFDIRYINGGSQFDVNAKDTIVYKVNSDGPEYVDEYAVDSPLHSFCYPCIIKFDQSICDTIQDNGPAEIRNFEVRRLGDRYIEYTYRYKKDYVDNLNLCD